MSKKEQINKEIVSEEIKELTKLIDQNNAVINHQMEEVGRLVREMDKKTKENNGLIVKTKRLLEKIQIKVQQISQKRKNSKKT